MSLRYDKYLTEHYNNVERGFYWFQKNLPEVISGCDSYEDLRMQICVAHDMSKYEEEEYDAYDKYFYGREKTPEVKQNFQYAWLHHIHHNPHHWQHWVLINDEPGEGLVCLDMPYNYILEMICDWLSFSWKAGNLDEIFSWYDEHKAHMKLSDKTRETVEDILEKIKNKLEEEEDGEEDGDEDELDD